MMVARLQAMPERAPTMPALVYHYNPERVILGPSPDKQFEKAPKAAIITCENCGSLCRIRLIAHDDMDRQYPTLKAAVRGMAHCPRQPAELQSRIPGWRRAQEAPKPPRKPAEPRNKLGGLAYKWPGTPR